VLASVSHVLASVSHVLAMPVFPGFQQATATLK